MGKGFKATAYEPDRTLLGGLSLLWGFDEAHLQKMRECQRKGFPFIHMDHAYFKRGYENGLFRANFNHFHQTRLLDVPSDRSHLGRKRLQEWKTGGRHVVLILPSERICNYLTKTSQKNWQRVTFDEIRKHTDRPIVVKEKGPGLAGPLKNAWACVSLSSVAEVESVLAGVPVFVSQHSPACQVGLQDLSLIEKPISPDREMWLNTLGYSQFHVSEMADGTAASILRNLYGL